MYPHVAFTTIDMVENVRSAMLLPENGYDTVVLSELCDVSRLPADFKKALALWVAGGRKLIIQDADACEKEPDYSFLPFKLVTSNSGANGASSDRLILGIVNGTSPRGETPLVYLVMQAADDLKAKGGGSIVLVTDGEESCGGDPAAAGQKLK
ncbi:MAG TPA: hypothetical protein VGL62_05780, partial [Vicinamibacterales bacterium]